MAKRNEAKATKLYDFIDQSDFYYNPNNKADRSWMNITFRIHNEALEKVFIEEAGQENLLELKGHRSVGGMRASLYNAMPEAGVQALCDFMQDFASRHQ